MPISQARIGQWRCARCGEASSRLTWLAVDAVERPDLLAQFSSLVECKCPSCGGLSRRSQPLLVLRFAIAAPVIAVRASGDESDPFESLGEVAHNVVRELGDALLETPNPAVVVTFDEMEAGVQADIDADLGAILPYGSWTDGDESAYQRLLGKIAAIQDLRRIEIGLTELVLVGDEAQLRDVIERHPEIMTDEAERHVAARLERVATEDERQFLGSILRTLQLSRKGDFQGAWSVRESVIRSYQEETVAPRLRAFEDAKGGSSSQLLARAGRDLLAALPPGVDLNLQAEVAADTVVALLRDEGVGRDESIERAIALGHFVLSILDANPELDHPRRRLIIATNLSAAYGWRSRGDPTWNLTQGITHLSSALDGFPRDIDPDSWAMAHTNLALFMVYRGEAGDHDLAREHLELALTYRSFQRNPRDWAYTQLNLAVAYSRAESGDRRANVQKAIRCSAKARYAARAAEDVPILGQAEYNLASQQYRLARMADTMPADRLRFLDRAEVSATESARLSSTAESPGRHGRAWGIIGKIRLARGDISGAIEALKIALAVLVAAKEPNNAREAGRILAALAEDQSDIELAADASERLVEAAAAAISARSHVDDRVAEQRLGGRDFRFSAHALVRAGRLPKALVAIESGRARELGLLTLREQLDLDRLSHLDPALRARVDEVGRSYRAEILGLERRSALDLADRLIATRAAVQQAPTFETAFEPPTVEEVSEVAQPRCPLVYLGAAPKGSFAITVDRDSNGRVELDAIHAPDCDSAAIAHLVLGISAPEGQEPPSSYLLAQMLRPELLDESIAALSPLIGEHLLRPLADWLHGRGASGVTLVPAGLFGLMPLHAIAWSGTGSNLRSLIDDFDVTYAPSARLQRACMNRASQRTGDPIQFVGIANPLPHSSPLPGAELEIELVQARVRSGNSLILKGEQATKQRVVDVLPFATHVHFACHAGAQLFAPLLSAAVSLSCEEELSALEVARIEIPARLVVASACQTGVLQSYEEVDESLGLASAFLAAGAAGVVSALWEVDDFATALIISKFYEAMFDSNKAPATALREAQLWIRDADDDVIDTYASSRAPLRALRDRRHAPVAPAESAPYSAPSIWAAFVFSGA